MRALLWLILGLAPPATAELAVRSVSPPPAAGTVLLDVRPLAACQARSLAGARCLPAGDFLDAQGRLAPWREVVWLLSTAGLTGRETVWVLGDDATDRRFVAGLLELAGQQRVEILEQPLAALWVRGWPAAAGRGRDFARQVAYVVPMREGDIVLPHEPRPRDTVTAADPRHALARWVALRLAGKHPRILLGGHT